MSIKEKTMDERLKRYAISQDDSLDRHMPPTSKKQFVAVCLLSPLLCLLAWGLAVYACITE
jgi:hypothetical protein